MAFSLRQSNSWSPQILIILFILPVYTILSLEVMHGMPSMDAILIAVISSELYHSQSYLQLRSINGHTLEFYPIKFYPSIQFIQIQTSKLAARQSEIRKSSHSHSVFSEEQWSEGYLHQRFLKGEYIACVKGRTGYRGLEGTL